MCVRRRIRSASAQSDQFSLSAWRRQWPLAITRVSIKDSDQTAWKWNLLQVSMSSLGPHCAKMRISSYNMYNRICKSAHVSQLRSKFDPFIPVFLQWTLPSLNLDSSIIANGISVKYLESNGKHCRSWWDGSYEPSHLDLHCLHKYLCSSTELKRLSYIREEINSFIQNLFRKHILS